MACSDKVIAEIASTIASRRRLYDAAYTGDLNRLRATHGEHAIDAALKLIEQQTAPHSDGWDAQQHAREVRRGIARVLAERRQRATELFPDGELLRSWR
jgi:hypothetical protein